jgi:chemotaxis protein MotB
MAEPEEESGGVAEWVVTYGDMMSLLLTFFIMLVSMSQLKEEGQIRAMMDAIKQAFGASKGPTGAPGRSLSSNSVLNKLSSTGSRSEGGMKRASRKSKGLTGAHRTVKRINHGTVVTLGGPTLFGRFDATLTDELKANLDVIVNVAAKKPNRLIVRGHASPEPLPPDGGPFLPILGRKAIDPMDLSYARAHATAEYLISQGIDRGRLLVSAAGNSEPRKITRRKELQKLNRRVDVFLIDSYITPSQSGVRSAE